MWTRECEPVTNSAVKTVNSASLLSKNIYFCDLMVNAMQCQWSMPFLLRIAYGGMYLSVVLHMAQYRQGMHLTLTSALVLT